MGQEEYLATVCPQSDCDKPIGDHSVREWMQHSLDPIEQPMDERPIPHFMNFGDVFGEMAPCDHVKITVAVSQDTPMGALGMVGMTWEQGRIQGENVVVGRVVAMGPPALMRSMAKLLNQAFHRSANMAEGKPR